MIRRHFPIAIPLLALFFLMFFVDGCSRGPQEPPSEAEDGGPSSVAAVTAQRGDERDILFDSRLEGSEIWAIRSDGSGLRRLTHSPSGTTNQSPRWSPDGGQIVFSSNRYAPSSGNRWEIYVMNRDGSSPQRLTYGGNGGGSPDWSPDGKRIAFFWNRDGNSKIYVMDANGSHLRRLTTDQMSPSTKTELGPVWSPDGTRIAFVSDRDGEDYEIYVLELETSKLTQLTDNDAYDAHAAWSPDGPIPLVRFGP